MKKTVLTTIIVSICAFIIGLCFLAGTGDSSSSSESNSALDINAIESSNFIVKTDEEGALPTLTKEQLTKACDCLSGEQKTNALKFMDDIIKVQDTYKVNAVFTLAVFQNENGIATTTDPKALINMSPKNYNIGSISGNYNGNKIPVTHADGTKQDFKVYPDYETAIDDFGVYISEGTLFFTQGKNTVQEIGVIYCDQNWVDLVKGYMLEFYKSANVQISTPDNTIGGDIMATCKEITDLYISRKGHYGPQTYGNIKKTYESDTNLVCATYVSVVLYKSGMLTEEHINKYNYHWTGSGGMPDMLKDAGWRQVPLSEAKPGDVWNRPSEVAYGGGHAMIYAGDGKVWDQTSCMISSSGAPPTGTTKKYTNTSGVICWRAPGK